jgi:hypothetical protein
MGTNESESEHAHRLWDQNFATRQLSLGRNDPDLFSIGRHFEGSGIGIVHEIRFNSIHLAIKWTYPRKLTTNQLNKTKILFKISEQRHHHVVQLIGSYIHRRRASYEFGLLIWPVAHCDLSALLNDFETLTKWLSRSPV